MKKIFEYEYESGKRIELSVREDDAPVIIIKEYNKGKVVKDFLTTLTGLVNACSKYEQRYEYRRKSK